MRAAALSLSLLLIAGVVSVAGQYCDYSCKTCNGTAANQCTSCSGYSFLSNSTCVHCHADCAGCTGPRSSDCLACSDSLKVLSSGSCYQCDESCVTAACTGPAANQCTKCSVGKYFDANGNCVPTPNGKYVCFNNHWCENGECSTLVDGTTGCKCDGEWMGPYCTDVAACLSATNLKTFGAIIAIVAVFSIVPCVNTIYQAFQTRKKEAKQAEEQGPEVLRKYFEDREVKELAMRPETLDKEFGWIAIIRRRDLEKPRNPFGYWAKHEHQCCVPWFPYVNEVIPFKQRAATLLMLALVSITLNVGLVRLNAPSPAVVLPGGDEAGSKFDIGKAIGIAILIAVIKKVLAFIVKKGLRYEAEIEGVYTKKMREKRIANAHSNQNAIATIAAPSAGEVKGAKVEEPVSADGDEAEEEPTLSEEEDGSEEAASEQQESDDASRESSASASSEEPKKKKKVAKKPAAKKAAAKKTAGKKPAASEKQTKTVKTTTKGGKKVDKEELNELHHAATQIPKAGIALLVLFIILLIGIVVALIVIFATYQCTFIYITFFVQFLITEVGEGLIAFLPLAFIKYTILQRLGTDVAPVAAKADGQV